MAFDSSAFSAIIRAQKHGAVQNVRQMMRAGPAPPSESTKQPRFGVAAITRWRIRASRE